MLYIITDKIRYSTVGATFTVHFSVAPDEIGYLQVIYEKYAKLNNRAYELKPRVLGKNAEIMIIDESEGGKE